MSSFFKKLLIRPLDFLFLAVFIAAAAFSVSLLKQKKSGSAVLIITSPSGEYVYDLNVNRELKIKGAIGISRIKIKDGYASFTDSPCPNKTCVQCAPIHDNLEWIACMPNQVFIRIERKEENKSTDISSY